MAFLCVCGGYMRVRLKTAEIIVKERPVKFSQRHRTSDMVAIMIPYTEKTLREALKAAGGRWDPTERLWRVRYGSIRENAELVKRIARE